MSKRALRRHHQKRFEARARKFYLIYGWWDLETEAEQFEKAIRYRANNRCPCSCGSCGNPRHHNSGSYKLTRQEIKAGSLSAAIREFESE